MEIKGIVKDDTESEIVDCDENDCDTCKGTKCYYCDDCVNQEVRYSVILAEDRRQTTKLLCESCGEVVDKLLNYQFPVATTKQKTRELPLTSTVKNIFEEQ